MPPPSHLEGEDEPECARNNDKFRNKTLPNILMSNFIPNFASCPREGETTQSVLNNIQIATKYYCNKRATEVNEVRFAFNNNRYSIYPNKGASKPEVYVRLKAFRPFPYCCIIFQYPRGDKYFHPPQSFFSGRAETIRCLFEGQTLSY